MARHLATIGRLTVWDKETRDGPELWFEHPPVFRLSLDQTVELARLLIKTAAQHGWGSDEDKQRIIAWASVKK